MKNKIVSLLCVNLIVCSPIYAPEVPKTPEAFMTKYKAIAEHKKEARQKAWATIDDYGSIISAITTSGGTLAAGALAFEGMGDSERGFQYAMAGGALATVGLVGLGVIGLFHEMVKDMYHNPDWADELNKFNVADFSKVVQIGGIPFDQPQAREENKNNPEIDGKPYLVVKGFDDTSSLHKCNHYELAFMPLKGEKGAISDFFKQMLARIKGNPLQGFISFIVFKPTPRASRSVWNGKILPVVLIGFKPEVTRNEVAWVVSILAKELKEWRGTGQRPRYSEEIPGTNKLMYAAYGSGDCKDTKVEQMLYQDMRAKPLSRKEWLWSFVYTMPEQEDMAYQSEDQRISTVPAYAWSKE